MWHEDPASTIERLLDGAAAAALGAACIFAGLMTLGSVTVGAAAGIGTTILAWLVLRRIETAPTIPSLPKFEPPQIDCQQELDDELLLTEVLTPAPRDELLLDDILEQLGPDARVVRLFAKPALPTAGELLATIDRHLDAGKGGAHMQDASAALSDALADLRRSLR